MYGIFAYIWLIFLVNVGKYTIHGSSGIEFTQYEDSNAKNLMKESMHLFKSFNDIRIGGVSTESMELEGQ